ncbi:glycosyltransferase [Halomonas sp.]|uniref:glycosyltransferase n=1 Tax=Halomonas sp. TaxID=1486246 RepID=UPI003F93D7ED
MESVILQPSLAVCVPTLNAGALWPKWLECFSKAFGDTPLLVVDSSSSDQTAALARDAGAEVVQIARGDFDHGATRDWALRHLTQDVVVFLTQDALPVDTTSLTALRTAFSDTNVAAAFGRQLPHRDATPIAAHARLFNYPAVSRVVSKQDIPRLGIKTAFLSNSFAAYRRQALLAAGGFPHGTILSEDMLAGARLLQADWKLAYCADARVFHSHNYSLLEEFRRYFDIGVFHQQERWLIDWLGRAEGEGARFVTSETRYLLRHAPWCLPEAALRTLLKYAGYRLGQAHHHLPNNMKRRCSMNRRFW